jgi:hypothetical protein
MAAKTAERLSLAPILFGVGDWAVEVIDTYGRLELLLTFPILKILFNPLVAPGLILFGAILFIWIKTHDYERKIRKLSEPLPRGVLEKDGKPWNKPESPSRWYYWIVASILLGAALGTCFVFIVPYILIPIPPPNPRPPEVHFLALTGSSQSAPVCLGTSIKQTMVENNGRITGGNFTGNTQIAMPDGPKKQTVLKVDGNPPPTNITNITTCFGSLWSCVVYDLKTHLKKGEMDKFDKSVSTVNRVIGLRTFGRPLEAAQCQEEFANAVGALKENQNNDNISGMVPICLRQP